MISTMAQRADGADAVKRARLQMRSLAIAMALIANTIILAAGRIITGDLPVAKVGDDVQTIEFINVVWVTFIAGLLAWGLLALLERTTGRAATIWLGIATVFFLFSLIGPLGQGDNTSSKIVLALMHVAAFATIVPMMWRSARLRCD